MTFASAQKRRENFYTFNRNGKLAVSCVGMVTGTFLICLALMFLQNS